MRNVETALMETLARFRTPMHWRILPDGDMDTRWRIQVWSDEDSLLEVEVLNLQGEAVGCVLERRNVPFRTLQRFMDTLMDKLEGTSPHPPGGEP